MSRRRATLPGVTHSFDATGREDDPQSVIEALYALSARFQQEASTIDRALGAGSTATDGLTTMRVDLAGTITELDFSDRLGTNTPPRLAESMEQVYVQALTAADEQSGEQQDDALTPPSAPAGEDITEALQRLASFDQWGRGGVLASSPYADPQIDREPTSFNQIIERRVERMVAAYEQVGTDLGQVVGRAESARCAVEVAADGTPSAFRFTPAAITSAPADLAADVLATLRAAAADAEQQQEELLSRVTDN